MGFIAGNIKSSDTPQVPSAVPDWIRACLTEHQIAVKNPNVNYASKQSVASEITKVRRLHAVFGAAPETDVLVNLADISTSPDASKTVLAQAIGSPTRLIGFSDLNIVSPVQGLSISS